jgi:hypothetical protein
MKNSPRTPAPQPDRMFATTTTGGSISSIFNTIIIDGETGLFFVLRGTGRAPILA